MELSDRAPSDEHSTNYFLKQNQFCFSRKVGELKWTPRITQTHRQTEKERKDWKKHVSHEKKSGTRRNRSEEKRFQVSWSRALVSERRVVRQGMVQTSISFGLHWFAEWERYPLTFYFVPGAILWVIMCLLLRNIWCRIQWRRIQFDRLF